MVFDHVAKGRARIIIRFRSLVRIDRFAAATTWWLDQWVACCAGCLLVVLFRLILFRVRNCFLHIQSLHLAYIAWNSGAAAGSLKGKVCPDYLSAGPSAPVKHTLTFSVPKAYEKNSLLAPEPDLYFPVAPGFVGVFTSKLPNTRRLQRGRILYPPETNFYCAGDAVCGSKTKRSLFGPSL